MKTFKAYDCKFEFKEKIIINTKFFKAVCIKYTPNDILYLLMLDFDINQVSGVHFYIYSDNLVRTSIITNISNLDFCLNKKEIMKFSKNREELEEIKLLR
ncbi:MAG: hypothetical protein LC122_12750 [Chitinophagales bacterium]|nr:hypothetical protein [Chitinophagales bacterium]